MWPFSKRAHQDSGRQYDGPWFVAQGESGGNPLILRVNQGVMPLVGDARFVHHLVVRVEMRTANEDGLPSSPELIELNRIEDALCDALLSEGTVVHAATITGCGEREFLFYTSDVDYTRRHLEAARLSIRTHQLEASIDRDAQWQAFEQFAPLAAAV